jgi:hypothetical protein
MALKNKTRKTLVSKNYRICKSNWSKARGLMFTDRTAVLRESLIFDFDTPRMQSLHMFFVFYPIDVLFLSPEKSVVEAKSGFRPFTVYNSSARSKYVIELPNGTIAKSRTRIGDVLEWQQ